MTQQHTISTAEQNLTTILTKLMTVQVLGLLSWAFFIPIVGLIIFLICEGKKPKRAKSAGKGALIGFITKVVLSIILVILYAVFTASLFSNISDNIESNVPSIGDVFREETTDEIIEYFSDIVPKITSEIEKCFEMQ